MIKNIIFDFGNVIGNFDYEKIVSNFTNNQEEKDFLINQVIKSPEWLGYGILDSGLITYDAFVKLINDRTDNIHKELVDNFINNYYKYITISDEIRDIIKEVKNKGYNLYLLSNTTKQIKDTFKNDEIFDDFSGFVLSYKINMTKPHIGIYKYLLDTYKLMPNESLFIDDNQNNMDTANKLGINGRKVNMDDVKDIRKVLNEFNIL